MSLFRTILVAADFSDLSLGAFRIACSLAHPDETRLIVLHAEAPPIHYGELDFPLSPIPADPAHLEELSDRLREFYAPDHRLRVEYRAREGFAVEEILRTSDELDADLIVMGTHGRAGIARALLGSVAEVVLRKAKCPVLMVKAPVAVAAETAAAPGASTSREKS